MMMRPKAFLVVALITSGIAAVALTLGSCGPKKAPEVQNLKPAAVTEPDQADHDRPKIQQVAERASKNKTTLFEKDAKRSECAGNPSVCDGDFFQMDIKKELKTDLDKENGVTSTFCAGGCSKKSAFKWSLDW